MTKRSETIILMQFLLTFSPFSLSFFYEEKGLKGKKRTFNSVQICTLAIQERTYPLNQIFVHLSFLLD
jgi:hypothetical protein